MNKIRIYNAIFDIALSVNPKLFLLYMIRISNENQIVSVSLSKIAKDMMLSKNTVIKIIRFWQWTGFVDVLQSSYSSEPNTYKIKIDELIAFTDKIRIFDEYYTYYEKNYKGELMDFEYDLKKYLKNDY